MMTEIFSWNLNPIDHEFLAQILKDDLKVGLGRKGFASILDSLFLEGKITQKDVYDLEEKIGIPI